MFDWYVYFSKGTALTSADVRRDITEYVKINELQNQQDKKYELYLVVY